MELLIIIFGVLFVPVLLLLVIEHIVEVMPESHWLVKWWREHIIGRDGDMF